MFRHVCGLSGFILLLGLALPAGAGERVKSNKREKNQEYRIKKGVKSGKLTKKEAKKLAKQQKHIDRYQRRIASDGTITKKEKWKLHKKQKHANKAIYKQKHDRQNRFSKNNKRKKFELEAAGAKARQQKEISDAQALTLEE